MFLIHLIAPTGILAGVLFVICFVTGFRKLGFFRYHRLSGYACGAVSLFHSYLAISHHAIDPLGILAMALMIATVLTGVFPRNGRRKVHLNKSHLVVSVITTVFIAGHVALMLFLN